MKSIYRLHLIVTRTTPVVQKIMFSSNFDDFYIDLKIDFIMFLTLRNTEFVVCLCLFECPNGAECSVTWLYSFHI